MANEIPDADAPHNVIRIKRFQIGLNVLLQFLLVVVIIGFVNYLAFNHYKRWDFSRDKKTALAGQSKRFLKKLDKKARVIVFFSRESDVTAPLSELLKEMQYASRGRVSVEFVDPYRNQARA